MIKSIHFENYKALRDATLPLGRFTLIVGPNGSGKSTALQAFQAVSNPQGFEFRRIVTADLKQDFMAIVEIKILWDIEGQKLITRSTWDSNGVDGPIYENDYGVPTDTHITKLSKSLSNARIFSFNAAAISKPVQLQPNIPLSSDGSNLAGVLDNLRDSEPERFDALNEELSRWLPEFDRILFDTPIQGQRAFLLRTRIGKHRIQATDLSHGTLFALAFLTLSYLPNPPSVVCLEEPEHGMHPRLLREIRDAMYRLCYPEDYGDKRQPVQVIATTHSPYMLDLYKDHPEEVVIAHKDEQGIHFERLADKPNSDEFLQDAPLGEVWYSGILGGVPSKP